MRVRVAGDGGVRCGIRRGPGGLAPSRLLAACGDGLQMRRRPARAARPWRVRGALMSRHSRVEAGRGDQGLMCYTPAALSI